MLSAEEEMELVRWITRLTTSSYPPRPRFVQEMAEAIRSRRVIGINKPSAIYVLYDALSQQWASRFMNRHSELNSIIPDSIEAVQITESSHKVL